MISDSAANVSMFRKCASQENLKFDVEVVK